MKSISDFIEALGGASTLSSRLKLPATTVASWKSRNSIPVDHWPSLVGIAGECGIEGVTYEQLVSMHTVQVAP